MTTTPHSSLPWYKRVDWVITLFLILTPVAALILVPYHIATRGFNPWLVVVAVVFLFITSMSITGGYHRLFAHRAFEATPFVRFMFILLASATFQGSALKWSSDHRRHHRLVDTDDDPYSINKGFWYAHILWLFTNDPHVHRTPYAPDLQADKWIMLQHNHYVKIAILMSFGVPTLIGLAMGDALGGLAYIGFARLVVSHHCTFLINSACHMIGTRPYSEKISARDSFIMALCTYGEGYHNYHHKFETDYRNGIRWYQYDPTKWAIALMSFVGMTSKLKRVHPSVILRARLQTDEGKMLAKGIPAETVSALRTRVEEAQNRIKGLVEEYEKLKVLIRTQSHEKLEQVRAEFEKIKRELKQAQLEFKLAFEAWCMQRKMALVAAAV